MATQLQFVVTITTNDDIAVTAKLKKEFTQNILDGLIDKVNSAEVGIVPETTDTFTKKIAVRPLEERFGLYERKTEIKKSFR
jgi:hypothetical protein